jgi:hypothetical protein
MVQEMQMIAEKPPAQKHPTFPRVPPMGETQQGCPLFRIIKM